MIGSIRSRDERGAVVVMTAIMLVMLVGFLAIAVDVGLMYAERRGLQRSADLAALAGATQLRVGEIEAEDTARAYYAKNPTLGHLGDYDPGRGDIVDARIGGCDGAIFGFPLETFDCIDATMASPEFPLNFAPVLGFDTAAISAKSRAILGAGAPGGEKLVPWIVIDCPDAYGEGRGYSDEASEPNATQLRDLMLGRTTCPYRWSDIYTSANFESLFLASSSGGNFQGADMNQVPDCPAYPRGYFVGDSGGNAYRENLGGYSSDEVPCNIGPGARISTENGQLTGPTRQGLEDRAAGTSYGTMANCMNSTAFNNSLGQTGDGDGIVTIEDPTNPCIVAILLVAQERTDQNVAIDVPMGPIDAQHRNVVPIDPTDDREVWRFSDLTTGRDLVVVRRFAFFYITELGNTATPYRGLFLSAIDTDAVLIGGIEPDTAIFVTRLVPWD